MFNKAYVWFKEFIIENYLMLLFLLVFLSFCLYPLPYYISTGGGIMNADSRVFVQDAKKSSGSFHFAYVSQLQATIPSFLLAKIIPSWEIESIDNFQITEEETVEEIRLRDHLYLEEANTAAIFQAYQKAGKKISIQKEEAHVIYIADRSKNDLKIGDVIQNVDGKSVSKIEDIRKIVEEKEVGDTLSIQVLRDGKNVSCSAEVYLLEDAKVIGITALTIYDYQLAPHLSLTFKNSESGPSGGLTLALTIYNKLTDDDLTRGRKIVGTGTIDMDGNVGEIGGVLYKLQGAVKNHADVFIVPKGENYDDCIKAQKEQNFAIQIIGVDTFEEAIEYLKNTK